MTRNDSRAVATWLLAVAVLVFAMVILGGVTRLTRSGLSIVEWNLVTGAVPPLSEQQWVIEFEKYKLSPEYQQINTGMTIEGFQRIFYVEWAHRLLGRLIGFAFLLPLLYFALRRKLDRTLTPKLIGLFILGGLQGALGWFMVKSGLVDVPRVSPYRLTAHLGLAVIIYGYLLWIALDLLFPKPQKTPNVLRRVGWGVTGFVFVTVLAGGFVAGTKAGFAFNTWPLMYGQLVPPSLFALEPWWTNLFENIPTVQFNHRMLAYSAVIAVAVYAWIGLRRKISTRAQLGFVLLPVAALGQLVLGIATVLHAVPVALGALHQAGALILFTTALYLNHALRAKEPT
ncbi:MAG TPA: COX15/CtaA family protein [Burkholderiales bacterium]|nr:COX15/CtaA family protein [Burkholderiales bacterium]